jgi:predicted RNase H-like HicB family nuclease
LKEKSMRFLIIIEPTATGFSAHVPDLAGCVAAGETREETIQLLREAVELHLDAMRAHGEIIRPPTSVSDYVEVDLPVAP